MTWSESIQSVLAAPSPQFPLRFILGGALFLASVGTWASVASVEEVGQARGHLVPQGDVHKIHPVQAGKVTRLVVKEGQVVKTGQVIAEIDPQESAREVDRLQNQLMSDRTQLLQLQGLLERVQLEGRSRAEISRANVQVRQAAIAQARSSAATAQQVLTQLEADANSHQTRLDRLKPLATMGAIAQEQLFEVEQTLRDRQRTMTQNQGEIARAKGEVNQLQAELSQSLAEGDRTILETQQRAKQLEVEITQLQTRIAETELLLTGARAKLKQQVLRAPIDGVVTALVVRNPGEVVQAGQTIAELSPRNVRPILRASLPTSEAGFAKVGMPVRLKFDAYPYQDYGVLSGKVRSISPDSKVDDRSNSAYTIEVELDQTYIIKNQQKIDLKLGQTATADIVIRHQKVIDLLLEPIRKIQRGGITL